MHHDRTMDLIAGIGFAAALLLLAWVTWVRPEGEIAPGTRGLRMRSLKVRRAVAAIIAILAVAILALHIFKFAAE